MESETPERSWLRIADICEELGVARETVSRWISAGELACYRFGEKAVRIKAEDFEAFIESRRRDARSRCSASDETERTPPTPPDVRSKCSEPAAPASPKTGGDGGRAVA